MLALTCKPSGTCCCWCLLVAPLRGLFPGLQGLQQDGQGKCLAKALHQQLRQECLACRATVAAENKLCSGCNLRTVVQDAG